jgi:hypothetical protein
LNRYALFSLVWLASASAVFGRAQADELAAQTQKKTGKPAFKPSWRADVPDGTRRLALADVSGDKTPRLLLLAADSRLSVAVPGADSVKVEATLELGEGAEQFVAGHFAKGKPAVVVAPGMIYYRDGDKYSKKRTDVSSITGSVKFGDGEEGFFYFEGGGPPTAYTVDLGAANPLGAGREMPQPGAGAGDYKEICAHLPEALLNESPFPYEVKRSAAVGFFDPREDGNLYAWLIWHEGDAASVGVVDGSTVFGGMLGDRIWKSDRLGSKIVDAAFGRNPKNPKEVGLAVLVAKGPEGRGREVHYLALD